MLNLDKDALICDLAETYGIYDYESLPCRRVATFSCGLRDNSRIKMKIAGVDASQTDLLLASIVDSLHTLVWFKTQDGLKGRNRPASIVGTLLGAENAGDEGVVAFDSGEEFRKEWNKRTKGDV